MRKSIFTVLGPTDPVHDLTTVEAVNAALGLESNTADDAITAEQITNTSRIIATLCNAGPKKMRTFALLTIEESFRVELGEPVDSLYLRQFPIEELTSLTQDGNEADATLYELDDEDGIITMKCGRWCGEIIVNYSGGYDLPTDAPPLLAQACIQLISAQRLAVTTAGSDPNVRTIQHGDSMVSYFGAAASTGSNGGIPSSVTNAAGTGLIDRYIRRPV